MQKPWKQKSGGRKKKKFEKVENAGEKWDYLSRARKASTILKKEKAALSGLPGFETSIAPGGQKEEHPFVEKTGGPLKEKARTSKNNFPNSVSFKGIKTKKNTEEGEIIPRRNKSEHWGKDRTEEKEGHGRGKKEVGGCKRNPEHIRGESEKRRGLEETDLKG